MYAESREVSSNYPDKSLRAGGRNGEMMAKGMNRHKKQHMPRPRGENVCWENCK